MMCWWKNVLMCWWENTQPRGLISRDRHQMTSIPQPLSSRRDHYVAEKGEKMLRISAHRIISTPAHHRINIYKVSAHQRISIIFKSSNFQIISAHQHIKISAHRTSSSNFQIFKSSNLFFPHSSHNNPLSSHFFKN